VSRGFVVWLTGLPGSGKTSIAVRAAEELRSRGYKVEVLDGDEVRRWLSPEAGFTREDRRRHLLRVAHVARLLARNGVAVICSFVSPYRDVRREVREIVERDAPFVEVYVKCSLEECIRRDPKGLYRRALRGEIKHMTGIDDPYEEPEEPDITLNAEHHDAEYNARRLVQYLEATGLVRPTPLRHVD